MTTEHARTYAHKLKHQKHLPSTVFVLKQQMASLPNPYFNEALQHVENTYFAQLRTVLTLSGSTGVFFVVVVNVINNMLNRACILTYSWKKRKLHIGGASESGLYYTKLI